MISSGRRRRDRGLAPSHALEHRTQLRRLEVLEQIALGAGLDRTEQVGFVLAHGQHDDRDFGVAGLDLGRRLQSGEVGHPNVHEDDVRRGLVYEIDRLVAVRRLSDHFVAPGEQERSHAIPEESVIVN